MGAFEKLGDEVLVKELALQLWGGQVGGDANDKAKEMLPWLKSKLCEIRNDSYMEGRNQAFNDMKTALNEAMEYKQSS